MNNPPDRRLPYLKGRYPMNTQKLEDTPEQQVMNNQQQPYQQPQPQPSQPQSQPPQQPQQQQQQQRNTTAPTNQTKTQQPNEVRKASSRIDTEQIPRPSIRSEESINYNNYSTAPVPLYHPPASHNYFISKDDGNAGPRYIRSTIYAVGNEPSITNATEIPFGVVVQPLHEPAQFEEEVPQVQFTNEPIRCGRCKAYVNPFFQFVDSGSNYICNICKMKHPVPLDYYSPLAQGNLRGDKYVRSELHKGCYDIIAPPDYIKKEINNILILFCIELTPISVAKGVYQQIITTIQSILDTIPNPERTDIAFLTFDSKIQYYNIPQNLSSEPQIIIVSDLEDTNVPLPKEKLFLNLLNDRDKIDYMLEKLEKYAKTVSASKNYSVAIGTVLTNAQQLLSPRSGRILYFGCQPPLNGIGKVAPKRQDNKLFGTDEEKKLYLPSDQAFVKIGQQCLKDHISVDLFVFNEDSFELATVAPVSNITGGTIYYFPHYNAVINGTELHYGLYRNLTRTYAYDCIMTVRASNGIILFDYYTGSGKVSVRDLELSTVDSDKSITVMLKHDEKIPDPDAYVQYALLYTNGEGQRMIRVINLQLQVVNKNNCNNPYHNIFKTADIDAISLVLIRKSLCNITTHSNKQVRQQINDQLVNILHAYRKLCSSTSPVGQLILPETIKTLPLYIQALNKRDVLKQGLVKIDSRLYELHLLMTQTFSYINNFLYPKLYAIHEIQTQIILDKYYVGTITEDDKTVMPATIATTVDKMSTDGIYILDTSQYIYIYVCQEINQQLLIQLFGVQHFNELSAVEQLPQIDTDLNSRVNNIVEQLRRFKGGAYHPIKIIRQNSTTSSQVITKLFEDEQQLEKAYGDYLCEVHANIQAKGF